MPRGQRTSKKRMARRSGRVSTKAPKRRAALALVGAAGVARKAKRNKSVARKGGRIVAGRSVSRVARAKSAKRAGAARRRTAH